VLRLLLFGIGALVLAGMGVLLLAGNQPAQTASAAPPPAMTTIIVAARALRAGSLLQPDDLTTKAVKADSVLPGALLDTPGARSGLVGAMLRRMLDQQEPVLADAALRPGERGFLAAVLKPGMRAVSVAVDSVTGAAGLIWPGDRVDLILTQTIDSADQSLAKRVAGEIVLSDVQVIAVDQQLVQGGQAGGLLEPNTPSSRTITLQVVPEDASRIAVASRLGRLQVALRAAPTSNRSTDAEKLPEPLPPPAAIATSASRPAAPRPAADPTTMWAGDVSHALVPTAGAQSREVRVFQGSKAVEVYKF
jgi:pilus assembly protein CpaB